MNTPRSTIGHKSESDSTFGQGQSTRNLPYQTLMKRRDYIFFGGCWSLTIILWLLAVPNVNPSQMGDLGLVTVLPIPFYAALLALTISFSAAVSRFKIVQWFIFLHIALFIVIVHGTPVLTYDTLRYSWAWKHLGIVDYILRHGVVDRDISNMNVYHNWPGFFAAAALFTKAAGLSSPIGFAAWAPVFFNLLNLGALTLLLSSLTQNEKQLWIALWIVAIASWVGQDYFSPQAFALFFHFIALGLVAQFFTSRHLLAKQNVLSFLLLLLSIFLVIATSHQLTPFISILSLGAVTFFSRNRLSVLPLLMAVVTVGWLIYGATPFIRVEIRELIETFGKVSENLDDTLANFSTLNQAGRLVALAGRTLTLSVWGLAFVAIVRHIVKYQVHANWRLVALTGAPFLLLAGNSYGGEIQFRIYLFSLPFMALWVAHLLTSKSIAPWKQLVSTFALSISLITCFLVAYYGNDKQYYFSPNEISASRALYDVAPKGSLIVEISPNYPSKYKNYDYYTHVAVSREPASAIDEIIRRPVAEMERWMSNTAYTDAFLIITTSQKDSEDPIGSITRKDMDYIQEQLVNAPMFKVIYRNEEAVVMILRDRPREKAL